MGYVKLARYVKLAVGIGMTAPNTGQSI